MVMGDPEHERKVDEPEKTAEDRVVPDEPANSEQAIAHQSRRIADALEEQNQILDAILKEMK